MVGCGGGVYRGGGWGQEEGRLVSCTKKSLVRLLCVRACVRACACGAPFCEQMEVGARCRRRGLSGVSTL